MTKATISQSVHEPAMIHVVVEEEESLWAAWEDALVRTALWSPQMPGHLL